MNVSPYEFEPGQGQGSGDPGDLPGSAEESVENVLGILTAQDQALREAGIPVGPIEEKDERLAKLRYRAERALGNDLRQEQKGNVSKIQNILKILGIIDLSSIPEAHQADFFESRNDDVNAVIDLYREVISRRQNLVAQSQNPTLMGVNIFDPVSFEDLTDLDGELPLALRTRHIQQAVAAYRDLGFSEREISRRFQLGGKLASEGLLHVAWLSSLPFMRDLKDKLAESEGVLSTPDLFALASADLEWKILCHIQGRARNYDQRIGYDRKAYANVMSRLKTELFLSRFVFFGESLEKQALKS